MLSACRPLVVDVAENAFAAAFEDPRFPPLSENELEDLDIHISVLSPPEAMTIKDEANLIAQLRPGVDGLIIEDGARRATFLPAVWEDLPDRMDFLSHLKRKAGMRPDHWSRTFRAFRYAAESIP
jgi:AmmeMemoRadiSam system protein A